jgi:hypothetical protein
MKLVLESLLEFQRGRNPSEVLSLGKKKEIDIWLKQYIPFSRARINSEWTIDTKEVVIPQNKAIYEIPEDIQFNICSGNFFIRDNYLKSMNGCPKIVKGDFMVDGNKLVNLDGCPEEVSGDFYIKKNENKFTVDEIKKICNVGGRIVV